MVAGVGGVLQDASGPAETAGAVDGASGRQRAANDCLCSLFLSASVQPEGHTDTAWVSRLSTVDRWTVSSGRVFRCSLLSALRKCSRRWALLTSAEVLTDQEGSAEDVDSLHTVTVDVQGGRGGSAPSGVQDEFLGLGDVQCQVVRNTPLTKFQL